MVLAIPDEVKKLWDAWDLRGFIMLSLSLQVFLVLFSSSRKRTGSSWIILLIWSAYLLADWVAAVAVGLISSSQGNPSGPAENGDLKAFWAPFLLLHLGGPDTITSFALEDNELWVRHLLGLLLQVIGAIYIFLQSLPKNKLWLPTILVFIAGTIKYAERTCALYLASLDHFGDSVCGEANPGPEFERTLQIYSSLRKANLPISALMVERPDLEFQETELLPVDNQVTDDLDDRSRLQYAFSFFETFKRLIVGLLLNSSERQESREIFLSRTAEDAFRIIEIELSLMYEVLHTKVMVVRCKTGYSLRFLSFCAILGAFISFFSVEKKGFSKFDVWLTYFLLVGAIAMDFTSALMLVFSDWTVIANNWLAKTVATRVIKRRRWSESISNYNFMPYCLHNYPKWVDKTAGLLGIGGVLDTLRIWLTLSHQKFDTGVWLVIFKELKMKSQTAHTVRNSLEICSKRGDGVLEKSPQSRSLIWSITDVEYAESLLLWHIATELCYHVHDSGSEENRKREFCKLLSDYLFYLLVMQPTVMAPVTGNWQIIFRDTCAETKRFLSNSLINNDQKKAYENLLSIKTEVKPRDLKGGSSKSVLFDACFLADQLIKLDGNHWELMSKVWVELLSYAAINCRPNVHAQQPSKGGELLTFVWLLMNHLGLGTQFYETKAARLKFIVGK